MTFLGVPFPTFPVSGPCDSKRVAGSVTEILVANLLGAEQWNGPPFRIPREIAKGDGGLTYHLEPDVWWPRHSALVEVKSGINRFYVTQRQWRSYVWCRDRATLDESPIWHPRVYYAFVSYSIQGSARKYRDSDAVVRAIMHGIEYVAILDSVLVAKLIANSGRHDRASVTPLSPILGEWKPYHRVTCPAVRPWAADTRKTLEEAGLTRWRAPRLERPYRSAVETLRREGWGDFPVPPACIVHPCRPRREWTGPPPGGQYELFDPETTWDDTIPF